MQKPHNLVEWSYGTLLFRLGGQGTYAEARPGKARYPKHLSVCRGFVHGFQSACLGLFRV